MTIADIARALGLDEKTIDRDSKSIAESFRAGGIDLTTLNLAEVKFVAAVIVVELQKKCPHDSDRTSGAERDPARSVVVSLPSIGQGSGSDGRVGSRLPRRFKGKP